MPGRSRRSRGRRNKKKPIDLWRPTSPPPEPQPLRPGGDPSLLIRSLGDPPLPGQSRVAEHYFAAVVEQASTLATALAAASGLISENGDVEEADPEAGPS